MQAVVDSTSGSLICGSRFPGATMLGMGFRRGVPGILRSADRSGGPPPGRRIGAARTGVRYD